MMSLLTLLLAASSPAAPTIDPQANCPRTTAMHAYDPSKPVKPQKLGELPPANAYKAVYRLVRGCEVPVIVKYGVGRR